MSQPTSIQIVRDMTCQQYVEYVLGAFTKSHDRTPFDGAHGEIRFWHSINVHPDSAVEMLAQWGY